MKMNRRAALKTMGLGAGMLAFPELLLADVKPAVKVKAKSVIQIFLWGGMSHVDTFDMKPELGPEFTLYKETLKTKTDGLQVNPLLKNLAEQSDKFSVIRSMTHGNNGHETAAYLMQTGHAPGERLAYPSIGAVAAYFKKDYKGLIPPFVVMTQLAGRFSEAGFLPQNFKPFATGGDPSATRFEVEGVVARGITDDRQRSRRELLGRMNTLKNQMMHSPQIQAVDDCEKKAYELILGEGKDVFDLSREKDELRDRYGRHQFGQECLAARRLVEAGVPYVCINYPAGWDHHTAIMQALNRQLPQLDTGLATLFADLADRGLLDSTLVWCAGEFGRTPSVDYQPPWNGGRGHFGRVNSVVIGGGGIKGGCVVGSSDRTGDTVKDRPVWPVDLLGTIYKQIGVDVKATLPHPLGLPATVLPTDDPDVKSAGILTELL